MKTEIRGTGLWKCFNCYAFPIKAALDGDAYQECMVKKIKVHKFAETGECDDFKHWVDVDKGRPALVEAIDEA